MRTLKAMNTRAIRVSAAILLMLGIVYFAKAETVTFEIPSSALSATVACTAGTDCDAGSILTSPITTGDMVIVDVTAGCALDSLTTHGVPYFENCAQNTYYTVYQWDDSESSWLASSDYVLVTEQTTDLTSDIIQDVIQDVIQDLIK
tara:strand:- start:12669 stop:13109 length:441 start_codon:yes stop_codon:yes gene_type:complete